jgi:hypothetical protein
MNPLPPGGHTGPLHWFPIGASWEGRYACTPAAPAIAVEQGEVKASLLASTAGAIVALEAVWQATDGDLAAARQDIADQHPETADVELRPADLSDVTASLTIVAHSGSHEAGPYPASGTSSNRVAFTVQLTAAEKLAAINAFGGAAGILKLRYRARLPLDGAAVAEVSADLADIVKSLAPKTPEEQPSGFFMRKKLTPPPPTLAACQAAVDAAVAAGQIAVVDSSTPYAPPEARKQATDALRMRLGKHVFDKLQQMGADAVYLASFPVSLKTDVPAGVTLDIESEADLGPWLQQHGADRLVAQSPAALQEPSR